MTGSHYNGWTNYPTWAVALWLGSDQGTAEQVDSIARRWEQDTREGGTVSQLADALRSFVEGFPAIESVEANASLAADLLGFALDATDWQQIAEAEAADVIGGDTDDAHAEITHRQTLYLDHLSQRAAS